MGQQSNEVLAEPGQRAAGVESETIPTLDEVQGRLEELFSKRNLADDAFLQQHMSAQMYIPVTLIARHERMKTFCTDSSVIIAAAKQSMSLGVDDEEQMVRPALKPRRNTLILRDLPDDVTEDELRQLFAASPESGAVTSVKPDVNQTAFVAFSSDEAAQNAALWLRSQKLRGSDIKCAMKSEHFVRSFFPAAPSAQQATMPPYMMPGQPVMVWSQGAPYEGPAEYDGTTGAYDGSGGYDAPPYEGSYDGSYEWDGWMTGGWGPEGIEGTMGGRKGKSKGKDRRGKGGPSVPMDDAMQQFDNDSMFDDVDGTGGIPAGYPHEYRKYSRQHIVEVCSSMAEISKPEAYRELEANEDAMSLLRETPCKEWAPLLTIDPLFPMDEKRSSEDQGDFNFSGASGRSERKERAASWSRGASGRQQGRSQSVDLETYHEEADWAGAEDSAWSSQSGWWQPSWPSTRKGGGKGHSPDTSWAAGPQWVEKGKGRDAEDGDGQGEGTHGGSRPLTWAEKVRGSELSAQRWVAKKKVEPEGSGEQAESGEKEKTEVAEAVQGEELEAPEGSAKEQEGRAMSWADKVRRSAS